MISEKNISLALGLVETRKATRQRRRIERREKAGSPRKLISNQRSLITWVGRIEEEEQLCR
jgi:hypothetical protein